MKIALRTSRSHVASLYMGLEFRRKVLFRDVSLDTMDRDIAFEVTEKGKDMDG